ncbi:DNA internalization-related competence protein ComEC/Rec2 [Ideonella sp. A 288]|uniref:DNA internalization-related competence protein ComEC/Rec2 n=1 Tax=Ideonella sp. A 288 TaxID=1962181 RepID=UPI000B4B5FEB|nr:DNA internalization-related competence protein ComEC/Rec2 [Ideonella sp. A 288]
MAAGGLDTGWRIALCCLGWLAGMALQLQQPVLWPAAVDAGLCGGALVMAALGWRWRGGPAVLLLVAACAMLGAASTSQRAQARLAQGLAPDLEGADLVLTGVVASLPQAGPAGTRFTFEVESAQRHGRALAVPAEVPARVALGWYRNDRDEAFLAEPQADLRAGQRWRLPVRLKRPHGAMNPGGFDAELWWWEQGLRATGYVRVVAGWVPATLLADGVAHPVERARQSIRDAILREVRDPRLAGVLAALVVGDQAAIERDDWELFRQTGIAHLMSISGVHVTMFAWIAGLAFGWAWRRSTRLMLRVPAPTAGRWGGLAVAAGYALIAGWGVPAERTVLMLACGVLLRSLGARWPWLLVLMVAAVAVTLLDPWSLLQPGFWLSFAAVGLLLASESPDRREAGPADEPAWRRALRGHLRAQGVATLGLAPLSLVCFQQVSVVGFVANLVAIPCVTLLVTPLALLGVALAPLWQVAAWAVQALGWLLGAMADWPFAVWTVAAAPAWAVWAGLAGALLAVLPLPWRLRAAAVPMMLPLLWPPVQRPADGAFDLVVADVGQGTAVLVRTRAHLLLYDTGPQYSRESDAGQRVLLPLLRARGETRIDRLVLSHRDIDHVGGAATLFASLPVADTTSSLEAGHPLLQHGPHRPCEAGQSWTWDGVRFDMLHPTPADMASARKPNAVSCVLRVVDAQGRSLLVTGDIEAPQEAALVQRHGASLASTWLLVPHHGSRTSSTDAFLDAVQPTLALVQAGYRSRFGHPAPDVMERYRERGIAIERTDLCGAWLWHDGAASCTREVRRRYWHWNSHNSGVNAGADVANPSQAGELKP